MCTSMHAHTYTHVHSHASTHGNTYAHTHTRYCQYTCKYWAVQWSWFAWVNALCNLSCKKSWEVTASLPGQFLSRHCLMLCITMQVEPRIVKQYKCHHCCSCKNYWRKGMEGGKKCLCIVFWGDQKIASSWKKCVLGHPIAWATSHCLLPDTS